MKIATITNSNIYSNNILNINSTQNKQISDIYNNKNIINNSTSFKGEPFIAFTLARKFSNVIEKKYKLYKIKKNIEKVLNNPQENIEQLVETLKKMSIIMTKKGSSLNNQEIMALNSFKYLDDSIGEHRVAKKEYMNSLANQNKISDENFIKTFKNLDDSIYKDFKTNLIEKLMYSLNFSVQRATEPSFLLGYSKLMATLPAIKYQDLFKKNINGIKKLDNALIGSILKAYNSDKNLAYLYYTNDFSYENPNFKDSAWKNHFKRAFYAIINSNLNHPENISKHLNMDDILTREIVLDEIALNASQKAVTKEMKLALLVERLEEKIKEFKTNIEPKLIQKLGSNLNSQLNIATIRLNGVNNYINKTEFNEDLKKVFHKDLYKMKSEINYIQTQIDAEYDIPIDSSSGRC